MPRPIFFKGSGNVAADFSGWEQCKLHAKVVSLLVTFHLVFL